jgi:hypothetical protein
MAIALTVDKLDPGGKISVRHIFYGDTLWECERLRDHHAAGCRAFGPALEADNVIETHEEIDDSEVPAWSDG